MSVLNLLHAQKTELNGIMSNIQNFLKNTESNSDQFKQSREEAVVFLSSISSQLFDLDQAISFVEDAEDEKDPLTVLSAMAIISRAPTKPLTLPVMSFVLH